MQATKPRIGRWLDDFGSVYSRGVIAGVCACFCALLATGVPLMSQGAQQGALYRALALLTTASPCALILVPLAYVSALAAITKRCPPSPFPPIAGFDSALAAKTKSWEPCGNRMAGTMYETGISPQN